VMDYWLVRKAMEKHRWLLPEMEWPD